MTLSEELTWRGFVNQTTLTDISELDKQTFKFYLGVDPSSNSMTVGNLAMIMMVKHFINYGHQAVLLVGGATGLIGDPDGKAEERQLQTMESVAANKQAILDQYRRLFNGKSIETVDNYDWFNNFGYLEFLREVGKHVPMRQMLGREFVQTRLGEEGSGISYAEFSYVLIQAYDFLYLHKNLNVNMQLCGSDQWGNSIAGVDLIRRITGDTTHVWSAPLVVNPQTGVKFGKSEKGAVWLDANKTSPTSFYQFWVNSDDAAVEYYLKIYTELSQQQIQDVMQKHQADPKSRIAQFQLADEVTKMVHGSQQAEIAKAVTSYITGNRPIDEASEAELEVLRREIPSFTANQDSSLIDILTTCGLAQSNTAARKLLAEGAIYVNGNRHDSEKFNQEDFLNNRLLVRRGKAYKDTALVELG